MSKIFEPFHKMLGIINEEYQNHKDENGNPLILHTLWVTVMLSRAYTDQDLLATSLGRYLYEKTDITKQILLNEGFSYRIVSTIDILTRHSEQTYSQFKNTIMESNDASRIHYYTLSHLLSTTPSQTLQYNRYKSFRSDIRVALSDERLILSP